MAERLLQIPGAAKMAGCAACAVQQRCESNYDIFGTVEAR
jgi:hypothetical protein